MKKRNMSLKTAGFDEQPILLQSAGNKIRFQLRIRLNTEPCFNTQFRGSVYLYM